MTASAVARIAHPPVVVGTAGMLWGYVRGFVTRAPRYDDPEFRRFLRRYQRRSLLVGKRRATRELDARQVAVWHPPTTG
jgi:poly-beta-1,6-N-acetyl-D-glucosamine synthase